MMHYALCVLLFAGSALYGTEKSSWALFNDTGESVTLVYYPHSSGCKTPYRELKTNGIVSSKDIKLSRGGVEIIRVDPVNSREHGIRIVPSLKKDMGNRVYVLKLGSTKNYDPFAFVEPAPVMKYDAFLKEYGHLLEDAPAEAPVAPPAPNPFAQSTSGKPMDKSDTKSDAAFQETQRQTAGGSSCPMPATSSSSTISSSKN